MKSALFYLQKNSYMSGFTVLHVHGATENVTGMGAVTQFLYRNANISYAIRKLSELRRPFRNCCKKNRPWRSIGL
jgi:hypothetical protein